MRRLLRSNFVHLAGFSLLLLVSYGFPNQARAQDKFDLFGGYSFFAPPLM